MVGGWVCFAFPGKVCFSSSSFHLTSPSPVALADTPGLSFSIFLSSHRDSSYMETGYPFCPILVLMFSTAPWSPK